MKVEARGLTGAGWAVETGVGGTVDEWMERAAKRVGRGLNPDRGLGARGHVQEGTVSSLCGNAVTLGRHFLSSVAPGTMGRAAFCRGNERGCVAGRAAGTRERAATEMEAEGNVV